jgi:hypothetical protein
VLGGRLVRVLRDGRSGGGLEGREDGVEVCWGRVTKSVGMMVW